MEGQGLTSAKISLRSMRFTWVQIASILGVSYMTVYRRRQEYEMFDDSTGTVTDNELRQIIQQMNTCPWSDISMG